MKKAELIKLAQDAKVSLEATKVFMKKFNDAGTSYIENEANPSSNKDHENEIIIDVLDSTDDVIDIIEEWETDILNLIELKDEGEQ